MCGMENAVVWRKDAKGNTVGLDTFTEDTSGLVHINVSVSDLIPGFHGIHIHEKENCTGPSFTSIGNSGERIICGVIEKK